MHTRLNASEDIVLHVYCGDAIKQLVSEGKLVFVGTEQGRGHILKRLYKYKAWSGISMANCGPKTYIIWHNLTKEVLAVTSWIHEFMNLARVYELT